MVDQKQYFHSFTINLAGINVPIKMHYSDALPLFKPFFMEKEDASKESLYVTDEDWESGKKVGHAENGMIEASLLTAIVSDYLMDTDRCVLHGAAFR